jgi:glycosyltransferase involved in cell wall biosynthesis
MKLFINKAKAAFDAGDYALAVSLYEKAMTEHPELASVYRFNLERAQSMCSTAIVSDHAMDFTHIDDLYREVALAVARKPALSSGTLPPVSVVMTAHNVAEYIEAAVTSLLRQSYQSLEIIVVDDASCDDTWRILQRIRNMYPIVIRRLNINLGTYFAKNYGLQIATGEYVFFQDGDDICHPERIRLSMLELIQPDVVCVQASYSRVLFPEGRVFPVNNLVKKLGLITLGLRKSIFEQIGFFNCTSKASDDELFQRLQAYCMVKGGEIRTLDLPLYYNTLREGSLFADMICNDHVAEGHIEQRLSPSRAAYVKAFRRKHDELGAAEFRNVFRFPVLRDLIAVAPDMSLLPNPRLPVVASVCSVPERVELLRQTLASLAPQVDALYLYLDRYESVPDFVRECHVNVNVVLSHTRPGLRDNGKFLPFAQLETACYYFTADDDIIYPPDYVPAMIRKIEFYGRQAVVGVHGVLVPDQATVYFSGFRKVHWFIRALERDALVNNLGTGTVAFYSGLLSGLNLEHFSTPGMADLYLAAFCKQRGVPMVAVERHDDWLLELESPTPSLFAEFSHADDAQSALIRGNRPWGYAAIRQSLATAELKASTPELKVTHERLAALMPVLHACLQ